MNDKETIEEKIAKKVLKEIDDMKRDYFMEFVVSKTTEEANEDLKYFAKKIHDLDIEYGQKEIVSNRIIESMIEKTSKLLTEMILISYELPIADGVKKNSILNRSLITCFSATMTEMELTKKLVESRSTTEDNIMFNEYLEKRNKLVEQKNKILDKLDKGKGIFKK